MREGVIDRLEKRLAPHHGAISVLAAAWFWVGVAIQARFLPVPDIPRALESAFFWAGVAVNVLWWGVMRPAIARRRDGRSTKAERGLEP